MCSVLRCESGRRGAQRFKLPEDPERRLEWVQFIFEVNGQRLRESSWTDITVCNEHFTGDCFEHVTLVTGMLRVQLKPDAVPSVCVKSEPGEHLERRQCAEPVETAAAARQCDLNSPISLENARHTHTGLHTSNAVMFGPDPVQQKPMNIDLDKEKAALLLMKGKHVVNESCLFQLFCRKCPSCGCDLQMEKATCGLLIVLNQQCLQCDYRNQWKSQVNASVPTTEDQHLTEVEEVTPQSQQEMSPDDNPSSTAFSEIVMFGDEESGPSDEGEDGEDGEWSPTEDSLLAEELAKESGEETEDEDECEGEEEFDSPGGLKITELCTECGGFFSLLKRHTCEHKIKPHSCNICGKRCATETSLKNHSRIHDETYDHPCKYCYVTFKTRLDKLKHEQTHQDNRDSYKCPDCPETFTTSKKRRIHLSNHRTPKEYKCGVCGIEFKDVHHLRRHSVVHTGLKPYQCSVCQRGFNQLSHLKSHMRLHTGERPYKCPLCDKSFNHNVSLKSHVQRHHSSGSGRRRKKGKRDERASDAGVAEDSGSKKGTGREFDFAEEERNAGEEVQKERTDVRQSRKRSTGRPRGRPKRNAAGSLAPAVQKQGQRSNTKKEKSEAQKKTGSSDEEREDEESDSSASFKLADEEEKKKETGSPRKSTTRSRRRPKNDSDTDFDLEEEEAKKKRSSSLSSAKSSVKCRGRPARNLVV